MIVAITIWRDRFQSCVVDMIIIVDGSFISVKILKYQKQYIHRPLLFFVFSTTRAEVSLISDANIVYLPTELDVETRPHDDCEMALL